MLEQLLDFVAANENIYGFLVLLAGSGIEYLFPPFPGDTITLLGGVLVAARGWSIPFVYIAATLGAVFGFMLDYALGRWLLRSPDSWLSRRLERRETAERVERVLSGFRRWGAAFLVINRFLPGIRAFFFVAAGMADMPPWKVLLWGTLSAAAWNALILSAGFAVGGSLPALEELFATYTLGAWLGFLLIVIIFFFVGWIRKRRARRLDRNPDRGGRI